MMNSRLARRGGVKRISGLIYEDIRGALKDQLETVRIIYSLSGSIFSDNNRFSRML